MWVGWMRGVGRGRGMGRGDRLLVWERGVIRGFGGWLYVRSTLLSIGLLHSYAHHLQKLKLLFLLWVGAG